MNEIQISDVSIKQNADLFSLNDLHKASGGNAKHQPALWLRSQQAQELIAEIQAEGKVAVQTSQGGKNRGTFVCKELVYAYATWISAKFFLLVIRTFDAVVSGKLKSADKTTTTERTGLRNAVNLLVSKKGLNYSEAYSMVHQRFNVESIEDLSHSQLNNAVEYLHRVILSGEVLDEENLVYITGLHGLLRHADYIFHWLLRYEPALRMLNANLAANLVGRARDGYMSCYAVAGEIGFKLQSHQYWANYPYDGDYDTTCRYRELNAV